MSVRRFLINNYPTWFFSNEEFNFTLEDVFYTEDPYTYEKLLKEGYNVIVPSDYTQERKVIDEEMSYKTAHFIKGEVNKQSTESNDGVAWGNVLNINMAFFVNTIVTRARELEYVLKGGSVVIPYLSKDIENNLESDIGRLTYIRRNYYGLLAQYMESIDNKYKKNIILFGLNYRYRDYNSTKKVTVSIKKKIYYRILSIISGDFNVFERLFFRYIRTAKYNIFKNIFNEKVYITGDNRMISSLVIPFIFKGFCPEYIDLDSVKKNSGLVSNPYALPAYFNSWMKKNSVGELQSVAYELILLFIENYISSLLGLNQSIYEFVRDIENNKHEKIIFLTNTPNSPDISLLYEHSKKNDKIKIISFTDGNSGVNGGDVLIEKLSVRSLCDGYVAHSQYEENLFRKMTGNCEQQFYAYNFTYYQRSKLPSVLKHVSRKFVFNQVDAKKYIIYAPTRFKEDNRFIKGDFIDIEYWSFIKNVVDTIALCSEVSAIVKTYGKEAYPGQMKSYIGDPKHPLELDKYSDNIVIKSYPRLNYMIQSSDIVIIDRATSTLQTALISKKIVIFINNQSHPVSEEVLPLLQKSIFVINAFDQYWKKELQKLMSLPMNDLQTKWKIKRKNREDLKKNYVLGIDSSKTKLIEWIYSL